MTSKRRRARNTPGRPRTPRPDQPSRQTGRREAIVLAAIGVPVLVIAAIAVVVAGGSTSSPSRTSGASFGAGAGSPPPLVYPDSPALGPVDAPVTLVEFLDPECESCRAAYPIVKQLLADYGQQVRLVVRYVPGHNNSALAAAAIEEAGRQGRYWETLEYFFEKQPEWGEQQAPQTETFLRYGAELGLDVDELRAALDSPDLTKVERDEADGQALGIRGTPTFFVNGRMVEELSEQALRAAIDAALGL